MKKIWIIAGVAGITVVALGVTSLVFAQSDSPDQAPGYGYGMMGGRGGYGGMRGGFGSGEFGPNHEYILEEFADATGLSPEETESRLASGETMFQIAEAEGISIEEFGDIMSSARTKAIEEALENGSLTQEQAEFMTQRMAQRGAGGFGAGIGGCSGEGLNDGFHHGRQGRWNAP